jgi:hypothetical protein
VILILKGEIDFVLAFPQANIECDIYMEEIPMGFCLKLKKNIYGTKQGGRVWNRTCIKGY